MEFVCDGKIYQMSDGGLFRTQIGKHDKSGKPRYRTYDVSCNFVMILARFRGFNVSDKYTKRLSYKASREGKYVELKKVRGF